jgi:hypothetical protein
LFELSTFSNIPSLLKCAYSRQLLSNCICNVMYNIVDIVVEDLVHRKGII